MKNVLVVTLSDKIYENKIKGVNEYIIEGEKFSVEENGYYPTCYFNKYGFDGIIFIGTVQSAWDYAYKELISAFIDVIDIEKDLEKIRNIKTENEFHDFFSKLNTEDIKIILMNEEKDYENTAKKIFEVSNMISRYDRVFVDITGGLRNQSTAILLMLTYLKNSKILENVEFNILGQYVNRDEKVCNIINMSSNLKMQDIMNKLNAFITYGNPEGLEKILEKDINLELFDSIYIAQQLNLVDDLMSSIKRIKGENIITGNSLFDRAIKYIIQQWSNIVKGNKNDELELRCKLIEYNYKKDNIGLIYNNLDAIFEEKDWMKKFLIMDVNKKNIKGTRNRIVHSYSPSIDINNLKNKKNNNYDFTNEENRIIKFLREDKILKLKESNILFWNIGDAKNYSELIYNYKGKKIGSKYSLYAYLNNDFEKIYIVGISTSGWTELLKDLSIKYEKDYLVEKIEDTILINDESQKTINNIINDILMEIDPRLEAVIIRSGINEEERESNFDIINKVFNKLDKRITYKIHYDITHGFRPIAILLLTTLHFFELLYTNLKIEDVKYAHKKNDIKDASIYSNKGLLELIRQYKNIENFEKYAKYNKKGNGEILITNNRILKYMEIVSNIFKFNDINRLRKLKREFNNEVAKIGNLSLEEEKIFSILKSFINEIPETERKVKIFFIREQLSKKNLAFALYNLIDLYYYDLLEFKLPKTGQENRKINLEKIKQIIKQIEKFENEFQRTSELNNIIIKLYPVRNKSSHTNLDIEKNKNRESLSARKYIENIEKALKLIEDEEVINQIKLIKKEMNGE